MERRRRRRRNNLDLIFRSPSWLICDRQETPDIQTFACVEQRSHSSGWGHFITPLLEKIQPSANFGMSLSCLKLITLYQVETKHTVIYINKSRDGMRTLACSFVPFLKLAYTPIWNLDIKLCFNVVASTAPRNPSQHR